MGQQVVVEQSHRPQETAGLSSGEENLRGRSEDGWVGGGVHGWLIECMGED